MEERRYFQYDNSTDGSYQLVTDPQYKGTYNYCNPASVPSLPSGINYFKGMGRCISESANFKKNLYFAPCFLQCPQLSLFFKTRQKRLCKVVAAPLGKWAHAEGGYYSSDSHIGTAGKTDSDTD